MVGKRSRYAPIGRNEYTLALISIPEVKGAELVRAAEFRLQEIYPGDVHDCSWDYRRLVSSGREELLVALIPNSRRSSAGVYIPLFHAVDLKLHRAADGVLLNEGGITDILVPNPDGGYSLRQLKETDSIETVHTRFHASVNKRGYRGAFQERRRQSSVPVGGIAALVLAALLFLAALVEIRDRNSELEELVALRREATARMEELVRLEEEVASSDSQVSDTSRRLSILFLLELFAETLPETTELIALDYSPLRTVVELEGPEPLSVLEKLRRHFPGDVELLGDVRSTPHDANREQYRIQLELDL